jgi:transposase-like protein
MVTVGDVACPRCDEDRVTLIHKIIDALGARYYCCVCAHEFKVPPILSALSTRH